MVAEPGDFLRVTNIGEEDTEVAWDGRVYKLPVSTETHVPFDAIRLACGDPRSTESVRAIKDLAGGVQFVSDRATEIRRLRARYDNQTGNEEEVTPGSYPLLEVRELDGTLVTTVLDDPRGESVTPANTSITDQSDLERMMLKQQQTIDLLKSRLGITDEDTEFSLDNTAETPTDADVEDQTPDVASFSGRTDESHLDSSDDIPTDGG